MLSFHLLEEKGASAITACVPDDSYWQWPHPLAFAHWTHEQSIVFMSKFSCTANFQNDNEIKNFLSQLALQKEQWVSIQFSFSLYLISQFTLAERCIIVNKQTSKFCSF